MIVPIVQGSYTKYTLLKLEICCTEQKYKKKTNKRKMLGCRFLSSTPLSTSPITTINDLKLSSYRKSRFRQSSISCTATNYSTKSDASMDSAAKTQEPTFEFLTKKPYAPPSWAAYLSPLPSQIYSLGHVCLFKDSIFILN